jgi:hypothetical protein
VGRSAAVAALVLLVEKPARVREKCSHFRTTHPLTQSTSPRTSGRAQALTRRDGEQLAHAILDMSERHTCPDPPRFVEALRDMFDALDPETIRQCTSDVLRDMIETIRQHQVGYGQDSACVRGLASLI